MALDLPLLVPSIRLDRDDGTQEATALRRAKQPWVAGFILFGGTVEQVAVLTRRLREEAGRHLFVAADMERGAGQQIEGLTQLPDHGVLGLAGTQTDAVQFGRLTAREAQTVGIDVVFAPCADVRSALENPILGNRSFGFDAGRVADLAAGYAAGIAAGGALPVVKHFPGHGATTQDSHDATPVVEESADVLAARDLMPFEKVIGLGCPALMTAHVAYPALDTSGAIATFSKPILDRARAFVRSAHGLAVFTDALNMAGAGVAGGEPEAARRALAAGCDLLLYPDDPEAIAAALNADDDAARAAENAARFTGLAADCRSHPLGCDEPTARCAERVARRAVEMASDVSPSPNPNVVIVIDDDDIENRGAVLARIAAEYTAEWELVRVPRGDAPVLPALRETLGRAYRAIVVFASARAWKGSSGVSPACRELVREVRATLAERGEHTEVLWCTPRMEDWRDPHVPGSGPHLEAAIGRRLFPTEADLARDPLA